MKTTLTLTALALFAALGSAQTVIDNDHTDLDISYDTSLALGVHFDPTDDDYAASDVLLSVYDNSLGMRPMGAAYDFIGNSAGADTYFIPESQEPDKLYLGIGMDSLEPDDARFLSYVQTDPRFNTAEAAKWTKLLFTGFTGPGQISTWQNTPNGPRVLFATKDGIDASDYALTPVAGDNHFNWAFTAPGDYTATFVASAFAADGSALVSDPATYNFRIGGAQPVPEPASFAALGVGALALLRRRRKA